MFTREEIEDVILGMAEIVKENRYLRARVEELEDENNNKQERLAECYKHNQEFTAKLLHAALTQPVERALALDKALKQEGKR